MDDLYRFETKYIGEDGWAVFAYNKLYPNGIIIRAGFQDRFMAEQCALQCEKAQVQKKKEQV